MTGIFDYVIVGAGSAGCTLAARLSEDPKVQVCLIEAGPKDWHPFIHIPFGIVWLMRSNRLNWKFYTEPENHLLERKLFWPRGKTLGGSSASNAMCYTRGHPADYDHWAALGNKGWGFKDVLPYFKRAEHFEGEATDFHGKNGPLNVAKVKSPNVLCETFVQAGQEAGIPLNTDFNGTCTEGVGLYHVTQKDGMRCSAAKAYLTPNLKRKNLTVLTDHFVTKVLIEDNCACGVEIKSPHSSVFNIHAKKEVILSAGTIQSPQLLLLSGIGPEEELQKHGIDVMHHLPGVGKNLQDHLDVIVTDECKKPVSMGITWRLIFKLIKGLIDLKCKKGVLTSNGAESGGFAKSSSEEPIPDLQFHFTPIKLSQHSLDIPFWIGEGYSLHVCFLRPESRGEIVLKSANPEDKPLIHANYLSSPKDLEKMIKGVKLARKIMASPAFSPYRLEEVRPGKNCQSDLEIEHFIREFSETIYHPVGTCKMGSDAMSVVDDELRVHGIKSLRVVDASIMPTLVGGNTNAPTIMIAERASDLIRHPPIGD